MLHPNALQMGKIDEDSQVWGENGDPTTTNSSSSTFCERCCPMCISRLAPYFTRKCLLVLILSFSVFLSAFFLLIPSRSLHSGFDASQTVKLRGINDFALRYLILAPILNVCSPTTLLCQIRVSEAVIAKTVPSYTVADSAI